MSKAKAAEGASRDKPTAARRRRKKLLKGVKNMQHPRGTWFAGDWRIIHHVISIIGAEDRCYRSLREHAKPRCLDLPEDIVPEIKFIDCSALKGLELPPLKYLAREIGKKHPALKKLSHQKIADALRTFGMRIPRSRPRK